MSWWVQSDGTIIDLDGTAPVPVEPDECCARCTPEGHSADESPRCTTCPRQATNRTEQGTYGYDFDARDGSGALAVADTLVHSSIRPDDGWVCGDSAVSGKETKHKSHDGGAT